MVVALLISSGVCRGDTAAMALTIICVCGTSATGKSSTIREFTKRYLRYRKAKGDVRGVFQMPNRYYAVGVSVLSQTKDVKDGGL
jgi:hypothetical protein